MIRQLDAEVNGWWGWFRFACRGVVVSMGASGTGREILAYAGTPALGWDDYA